MPLPLSLTVPLLAATVILLALIGADTTTLPPASTTKPPEPVSTIVELMNIEPAASNVKVAYEFHITGALTVMFPASLPVLPVVMVTLVPEFNSLTISAPLTFAAAAMGTNTPPANPPDVVGAGGNRHVPGVEKPGSWASVRGRGDYTRCGNLQAVLARGFHNPTVATESSAPALMLPRTTVASLDQTTTCPPLSVVSASAEM